MALLCGHVGRRRAPSTVGPGCVGVVCASRRDVGVDRRRACPHRRDVGALVHSQMSMVLRPHGHNGPARLCVAIAVVGPQ